MPKSIDFASSTEFIKRLIDAGVVPKNCTRVVIEADAHAAMMIHYSVFADKRILQVTLPSGIEVTEVDK